MSAEMLVDVDVPPNLAAERGQDVAEQRGPRQSLRPRSRAAPRRHRHVGGTDWLRDVILGGQDGLVNILGIILGVMAGGGSETVLVTTGFAAAITESISMGAVGYSSTVADRDYYSAQRIAEQASIREDPDMERAELRKLYEQKGFSGGLLDEVVTTVTADRDKWLATIMGEERHLEAVGAGEVARRSGVITIATLAGHLIPLLPFLFLNRIPALVLAVALSALVLFGVGVYSAVTRVGAWWKIGPKMIAIGLGAAGIGFVIGRLFNAGGA
jgi:VIT1/CCC1 family predicted Fe2+/Mn2+ transporter